VKSGVNDLKKPDDIVAMEKKLGQSEKKGILHTNQKRCSVFLYKFRK